MALRFAKAKPSFDSKTFAFVGDFTKDDAQLTTDNLKKWISVRNGRVVEKLEEMEMATHVIITEYEYKKKPKDRHEFCKFILSPHGLYNAS